ncbi:MAG: hypothetical protein Q8J78_04915 [Moraxellaceae bacterium]|nr:hypothetical protein [Moraxellaceae bacterium]
MKTRFRLLFALAALSLAGCYTPTTQAQYEAQVAQMGYGAALPADWQGLVKTFMQMRLKDSDSAIWQFDEKTTESWAGESDRTGTRIAAGHVVKAMINAKNSYGGYTGFEPYQFIIRDGRVIAFIDSRHVWQLL